MRAPSQLLRHQGDYVRARELYEEGLALYRALGNEVRAAECLDGLLW